MRAPPPIPEGIARTTIALRGAAGRDWLDRLPARIVACGERWSLEVGPPFSEPSFNYAAPTLRADGTAAVLKLSFPEDSGFYRELYREAEASGSSTGVVLSGCWRSTRAVARCCWSASSQACPQRPCGMAKRPPPSPRTC